MEKWHVNEYSKVPKEKIISKNNLISSIINGKCNFGIVEFRNWFIELN